MKAEQPFGLVTTASASSRRMTMAVRAAAQQIRDAHPNQHVLVIQGGASERPGFLRHFGDEAYEVGRTIAQEAPDFMLVSGGCSGVVARFHHGWLDGRVEPSTQRSIGIVPRVLAGFEQQNPYIDEGWRVLVDNFPERRMLFWELACNGNTPKEQHGWSGGILFMPGGRGTLDEWGEIGVYKQTNRTRFGFPISLAPEHYWAGIIEQLRIMEEHDAIHQDTHHGPVEQVHHTILEGARWVVSEVRRSRGTT